MKERFMGIPNVSIPETENDFEKNYDSYSIDVKSISHFDRTRGIFKIVYHDGDEYQIIYSDWKNSLILSYLFELKLLRLMNYWNRDK